MIEDGSGYGYLEAVITRDDQSGAESGFDIVALGSDPEWRTRGSLGSDDNMRRAVFGAQFVGLRPIGSRLHATYPPLIRLVWDLSPHYLTHQGPKLKTSCN